ncbi:hypothetical protein [Natronomonas sp.]|uniref:hypothetical protein n=1 Tax=Natronomonas sp. TaxID=2184060 RepID=UPI003975CCED
MEITPQTVADEHERLRARGSIPELINETRDRLGQLFGVDVAHVSAEQYRNEVDAVFADGDKAVNVAALCALLRTLDCEGDYPGFIVDEFLGRKLAATIAGGEPFALLAEATFHFADAHTRGGPEAPAGADDLDAALAAGFQTRLPGWGWTDEPSPFVSNR